MASGIQSRDEVVERFIIVVSYAVAHLLTECVEYFFIFCCVCSASDDALFFFCEPVVEFRADN